MNQPAEQLLRNLLRDYGVEIVKEPRRLKSLIADYAHGQHKPEVTLWLLAIDEGIVQELLNSQLPLDMRSIRAVKKLHEDRSIDKTKAQWTVDSWIAALGLRKEEPPRKEQRDDAPVRIDSQPTAPKPPSAVDSKASDALDRLARLRSKATPKPMSAGNRRAKDTEIDRDFEALKKQRDEIEEGRRNFIVFIANLGCVIIAYWRLLLWMKITDINICVLQNAILDVGVFPYRNASTISYYIEWFITQIYTILAFPGTAVMGSYLLVGLLFAPIYLVINAVSWMLHQFIKKGPTECIQSIHRNITKSIDAIQYFIGYCSARNSFLIKDLTHNASVVSLAQKIDWPSSRYFELNSLKVEEVSLNMWWKFFKKSLQGRYFLLLLFLIVVQPVFFGCNFHNLEEHIIHLSIVRYDPKN